MRNIRRSIWSNKQPMLVFPRLWGYSDSPGDPMLNCIHSNHSDSWEEISVNIFSLSSPPDVDIFTCRLSLQPRPSLHHCSCLPGCPGHRSEPEISSTPPCRWGWRPRRPRGWDGIPSEWGSSCSTPLDRGREAGDLWSSLCSPGCCTGYTPVLTLHTFTDTVLLDHILPTPTIVLHIGITTTTINNHPLPRMHYLIYLVY